MSRPTEQQLAAFRADIEAVCEKHGLALAVNVYEEIVIVPFGSQDAENVRLFEFADWGEK